MSKALKSLAVATAMLLAAESAIARGWQPAPVFFSAEDEATLFATETGVAFEIQVTLSCDRDRANQAFVLQSLNVIATFDPIGTLQFGDIFIDGVFRGNPPPTQQILLSSGHGNPDSIAFLVDTELVQLGAARQIRVPYAATANEGPTAVRVTATGMMPRGCNVEVDADVQ